MRRILVPTAADAATVSPYPEVGGLALASSLLYWLLVPAVVVGVLRLVVGRAGDGSESAGSDEDSADTHSNS